MTDLRLSQTTAAGALTGSELAYVVQSGNSRRTTVGAIANLAPATNLSYDPATRLLSSSTGTDVTLSLATPSLPGLESAADKAKLDSITVDSATVVRKFVRNNSGVNIPKGAAVYQTSSSGTTLTVALADASAEATAAQTLGLAQEAIADNGTGYIVAVGQLDGISTTALTEGQIVWLSETAGQLTTTRPTQPAHGVVLGYCVKQGAGTSGILYVKVTNGQELDELHDVLITSPTAGQVLRRAADGLWKNASLVATDISDSSSTGRAVLTAADATAARSAISAEQVGAAAAAQAAAVQRANHTGTQLAGTISDFSAAVAALGTTVGNALRSLVNPSAVSFLRINADNSVTARSASEMRGDLGLTSAATATIGTAAGNLVALDGSARLPAVDGSQLTGLPTAPVTSVAGRTGAITLAVGDVANAVATNDARLSDARTPLAHNQAWSTITGTPTTLAGYGITDAFNPAIPGPIGGTTPAAGTFTALVATTRLGLPSGAPASPVARDLYQVADTLRYRDSGGVERLLLNGADNLANLGNTATARTNLGLGSAATAASSDFVSATATRAANLVLAGPTSGAAAAPTFRALVAADLPAVTYGQHGTITASGSPSTYTLDAAAFNEFSASAAVAGNVTITASNLASVPSGQVWRAVFRFAYTSGAITLAAPAGATVKGSLGTLTTGQTYDLVVRFIGGGTVLDYRLGGGFAT